MSLSPVVRLYLLQLGPMLLLVVETVADFGEEVHLFGKLGRYVPHTVCESAATIVSCSCASREGLGRARAKLSDCPTLGPSPKHPCSCAALTPPFPSHPYHHIHLHTHTQSRTYIAAVSLLRSKLFSSSPPALLLPLPSSIPTALHTSRRPVLIPASQRWVSTTHSRRPWRVSPLFPTTPALVTLPSPQASTQRRPSGSRNHGLQRYKKQNNQVAKRID